MTLHVLIIEDDDDFVDELRETIAALPGDSNIRIAGSRDQAYEMLENGFLDLVILDLKIPTVSGALDADPEHGHAVFTRISNCCTRHADLCSHRIACRGFYPGNAEEPATD